MCPIGPEVRSSGYALYNAITCSQSNTGWSSEDQGGWDLVYLSSGVHGGELLMT